MLEQLPEYQAAAFNVVAYACGYPRTFKFQRTLLTVKFVFVVKRYRWHVCLGISYGSLRTRSSMCGRKSGCWTPTLRCVLTEASRIRVYIGGRRLRSSWSAWIYVLARYGGLGSQMYVRSASSAHTCGDPPVCG